MLAPDTDTNPATSDPPLFADSGSTHGASSPSTITSELESSKLSTLTSASWAASRRRLGTPAFASVSVMAGRSFKMSPNCVRRTRHISGRRVERSMLARHEPVGDAVSLDDTGGDRAPEQRPCDCSWGKRAPVTVDAPVLGRDEPLLVGRKLQYGSAGTYKETHPMRSTKTTKRLARRETNAAKQHREA